MTQILCTWTYTRDNYTRQYNIIVHTEVQVYAWLPWIVHKNVQLCIKLQWIVRKTWPRGRQLRCISMYSYFVSTLKLAPNVLELLKIYTPVIHEHTLVNSQSHLIHALLPTSYSRVSILVYSVTRLIMPYPFLLAVEYTLCCPSKYLLPVTLSPLQLLTRHSWILTSTPDSLTFTLQLLTTTV